MIITFILVFGCCSLVCYLLGILIGTENTKLVKNCDGNDTKLIPFPTLSPFRGFLVFTFVCQGSITKFLDYIRKRFKIVQVKLLNTRFVFINDFQLGRRLYQNLTFCAKSRNEVSTVFTKGNYGVSTTSGHVWKEQRKFYQQKLKEIGFYTKFLQPVIHQEIEDLFETWCDKNGEPYSPNKDFYIPVISSIWMFLTGERASTQNQELLSLVHRVFCAVRRYYAFPNVLLFPLKYKMDIVNQIMEWIPIFSGMKASQKSAQELHLYLEKIITERKKVINELTNPTNFVDVYLKQIVETTDTQSEFYGKQGESHLLGAMADFFIAGGDTIANALAWMMLHLVRNPDMQQKIYDEIYVAVGIDRLPCVQDMSKCPFTQAFLLEAFRVENIAICSLPHVPAENTNIGPYFIDEGTILFLNIYGINHNPEIWDEPTKFRPERFLSQNGKTVVKNDHMCSFSVGLRKCVGEQSAKGYLFLFVSAICQRFILKPDPRLKELPPLLSISSLLNTPKTFNVVAIDRKGKLSNDA